jgi:hypothetical protein
MFDDHLIESAGGVAIVVVERQSFFFSFFLFFLAIKTISNTRKWQETIIASTYKNIKKK